MCQLNYYRSPDPVMFRNHGDWLHAMAEWEAERPENMRARNKRRKWRKIHDFAAERFGNANASLPARFWYSAMMRAKANEANFSLPPTGNKQRNGSSESGAR